MLKRIATTLWGDFESSQEIKKFAFLASIFGLIIGVYWALRPIKDSAFNAIVGGGYLSNAKILSVFVTVAVVLLYGKLVGMFSRYKVFYGLVTFYALLASLFAWGFSHPTIGFLNTVSSPDRYIGWAFYVWVESFGSIIVALFWAITTDITLPESAKRGFPLIMLLGQMGNIFGPLILNAKRLSFANSAPIVGICSVLMFIIVALFFAFCNSMTSAELSGYHQDEEAHDAEPGFFEGLILLLQHWYLLGLFLIISVYEFIITIIDNHFKQAVFLLYHNEADVNAYLSEYAVMVGIISSACVLLGINNIQKHLGMVVSLVLTPILVSAAVLWVKLNPASVSGAFWIMSLSKAVNYALNAPTLKQLYIPTSKDAKYKAQAWIEMFGSRASKGSASFVNTYRKIFEAKFGNVDGITFFLTMSSIISFGLVAVWILVALYVAKQYNRAIKNNSVVC